MKRKQKQRSLIEAYIEDHDHKISFLVIYLIFGIFLSLMLNLSVLLVFIAIHITLDYHKYRVSRVRPGKALAKAFQEQLMDFMFVFLALGLSVYLSHKTPGLVGLYSMRAIEEVRIFSFIKALPRFLILEQTVKGIVHTMHQLRHHATHIRIPSFGEWEIFYVQIIIYTSILILIAPLLTGLTYADVWQNILVEISPWHIGAH